MICLLIRCFIDLSNFARSGSVGVNVHSFPLGEKIVGLALIDQQLYLLRERSCEEIDVYSTADHRLLRRINISDLNRDSSVTWPTTDGYLDIASCPVEKCLYLTADATKGQDFTPEQTHSTIIQRIDLLGNISQSNISDFKPYGISVAQNCNLLVSGCRIVDQVTSGHSGMFGIRQENWPKHAIVEWDWKASKVIREIRLALVCDYFWCHPVHLSNYHVVVHNYSPTRGSGFSSKCDHGVSFVDTRQSDTADRGLTFYRCYGSDRGSSVGRLNTGWE